MSRKMMWVALGVLACVAFAATTASAQDKCRGGKIKASGKALSGDEKCESKAEAKGLTMADVTTCEATPDGKLSTAFGKTDAKSGPCPGDPTAVDNIIHQCVTDAASAVGNSATTPVKSKCDSKKVASMAKKGGSILKCQAKGISKGTDISGCQAAAAVKFGPALTKAEAAGDCSPTSQSDAQLEIVVDNCVANIDGAIPSGGTTTTTIGGGTTTTTLPVTCQPIVTGNPISGTYKITSIMGTQKICTQNAQNPAKAFKVCTSDTDCGATGADLSCQQPPWVTLGPLSQPTPLNATTTFTVAEAPAPACEHAACITCGSLVTCPGLPACTTADCNGHLSNQCCNNAGFKLPALFVMGVNACTRLDQNGSGSGVVNSSMDGAGHNTGHNVVKKSGDTTRPDGGGAACAYDSPADTDKCTTPGCMGCSFSADSDTKGLVFRTVGVTACKTGVPPMGSNCPADADGIHLRLSTPGLSTTWQPAPTSMGGAVADCTCAAGSDPTVCGKYHNGTLLTQIQLNAEPTTAGAVGEFADHNGDTCAIGPSSQGLSSANPAGPISTVGGDSQKPIPYGGTGVRSAAVGIAFSNVSGEGDIGFASVTDNSGPTVQPTQACDSVPVAPPVGCPEPAGP